MGQLSENLALVIIEVILLILTVLIILFFYLKNQNNHANYNQNKIFNYYDLILIFITLSVFLINPIVELIDEYNISNKSQETNFIKNNTDRVISEDDTKNRKSTILNQFFYNGSILFFVASITIGIFQLIKRRSILDTLNFNKIAISKILIYSILGGVSAVIIGSLIHEISHNFLSKIFDNLKIQKSLLILKELDYLSLFIPILTICIIAPIAEEIIFRGYFYGILKDLTTPILSALLTSSIFAIIHVNILSLIPLFIMGLFFCLIYEKTKSLWVCIGIHSVFNTTSIILFFINTHEQRI